MRAIIGTLANSSIPRVQVTSLCSDWGIGAEKLYQLLFVMESVDLLKIVKVPPMTRKPVALAQKCCSQTHVLIRF